MGLVTELQVPNWQTQGLQGLLRDAGMPKLPSSVEPITLAFSFEASQVMRSEILCPCNLQAIQKELATELLGGRTMPDSHVRIDESRHYQCFFKQSGGLPNPYFLVRGIDGKIYALDLSMGPVYDLFVMNCDAAQC